MTRIAIIGGGFSGTLVAAHLLNGCPAGTEIIVVEKRKQLALGLAYSTTSEEHLLNVRAEGMSAFPESPMHFFEFARKHDATVTRETFVQRKVYAIYLQSILNDAVKAAAERKVCFSALTDEAIDISREQAGNKWLIELEAGAPLSVDFLVLATGNMRSAVPKMIGNEPQAAGVYVHDPWEPNILTSLPASSDILLIGTGLTAVDKILELLAQDHRGHIYAVSRHGLLPRPHLVHRAEEIFSPLLPDGMMPAVRAFKQYLLDHEDWRVVVDGVRPITQKWWKSLSLQEQKNFLHHLQTYWDVHRHRMAPQIAEKIALAETRGQVSIHAGRILSVSVEGNDALVKIRSRSQGTEKVLRAHRVVNCTGPEIRLGSVESKLYANMYKNGFLRSHALGFGFELDQNYCPIDSAGRSLASVFMLGPVLKPQLMETVAVPELRGQAKHQADLILAKLNELRNSVDKMVQA